MSSIMTSTVRKVGLDHFEPDLSTDPHAQRKLRGQLEKIDYAAFAANRERVGRVVGGVGMEQVQRLALAAADARANWVAEALSLSNGGKSPSPNEVRRLTEFRTAYEELSEVYEAMRRMIERGYLPLSE
jgi:hypothetical protein